MVSCNCGFYCHCFVLLLPRQMFCFGKGNIKGPRNVDSTSTAHMCMVSICKLDTCLHTIAMKVWNLLWMFSVTLPLSGISGSKVAQGSIHVFFPRMRCICLISKRCEFLFLRHCLTLFTVILDISMREWYQFHMWLSYTYQGFDVGY
jgi:hypothetical protein